MRNIALAVLVIALIGIAQAAPRRPDREAVDRSSSAFHCQLGQRLGTETDSLRMVVAVSILYDNLIFLRSDSGFGSTFEIVTSVFRDSGGLVAEHIAPGHVSTTSYAETNSRLLSAVHVEEFLVPPGDYRVRVTVTLDKETNTKSSWEGTLSLSASDPHLRLSDINWVSEDSTAAQSGAPRVVESFSNDELQATAHVQVFSSDTGRIQLTWTLLGDKSDTVRSTTASLTPTGKIQDERYVLEIKGLPARRYVLRLEAVGNGRREIRTREFGVRIPGIPLSVTDLDLAIRQLKYIATNDEMSQFRKAAPQDRERLFRDFWKRRDPTKRTDENELMEEYYLRVEYANDKFSTHRPGWETDRGRIWIIYGEPTDIERHPFEPDSRPYEIWFYAQGARRFVFVDYTGFGDYTLVTPDLGY